MTLQALIVLLVVTGCFGYAAWALLPQVARRDVAKGLLRLPLHALLRQNLERVARASGACQCSGCDQGLIKRDLQQKVVVSSAQPLLFYPRKS
jgi:hypothetical protein